MAFTTHRTALASIVLGGATAISAVGCNGASERATSSAESVSETDHDNATDQSETAGEVTSQSIVEHIERTRQIDSGRFEYDLGLDVALLGNIELSVDADVASADEARFSTRASSSGSIGAVEVDLISDGETGWFRSSGDGSSDVIDAPKGTWVRGPLQDMRVLDLVEPLAGAFTPLDLLHGITEIIPDGTDEVDGATTDRYAVTVDFDRATDAVPDDRRAALAELMVVDGADGPILLDGDAWVDADGRIVKLDVVAEGEFDGDIGDDGYRVSVALELSDADGEIEIVDPPEDDGTILELDNVLIS